MRTSPLKHRFSPSQRISCGTQAFHVPTMEQLQLGGGEAGGGPVGTSAAAGSAASSTSVATAGATGACSCRYSSFRSAWPLPLSRCTFHFPFPSLFTSVPVAPVFERTPVSATHAPSTNASTSGAPPASPGHPLSGPAGPWGLPSFAAAFFGGSFRSASGFGGAWASPAPGLQPPPGNPDTTPAVTFWYHACPSLDMVCMYTHSVTSMQQITQ
mmetsp:Transcript_34093/g.95878  ORF Transcript_34093/g.95878 Transcript_34093/m.95878 type:complete len:213 (-) Transcript_34093:1817-2455(-)